LPEATPAWVWAEELAGPGARVTLAEEDSRYVTRVCRARLGETLALTDGRGGVARGRLETIQPRAVIRIEALEHRESERQGVLLCGAAEGIRFDWAVEKLAELGVTRVRPIQCERARWDKAALRADRWRRLARAALLQSRGSFLLEVGAPEELADALAAEAAPALGVLADPEGRPTAGLAAPDSGTTVGIVGPAEGLTDSEKASIVARGFVAITLSGSRLRTETAAMAWAAWWAGGGTSQSRSKAESATS
jgi:16S rRNA (uracil1498-N3)-methyltransferase